MSEMTDPRMGEAIVYFDLDWRIRQTPEGWVGVCSQLGMIVDGDSLESLSEKSRRLVNFAVATFDRFYSESDFRDYLDRHKVAYHLSAGEEENPSHPASVELERKEVYSRAG